MRFMILLRGTKETEAGALPDEKMLTEMGKFNDELVKATAAAASEADEATRKADYIELQKKVLDEGPYIIMFQQIIQRADRANVKGYVQGSSADVTYYNLATK